MNETSTTPVIFLVFNRPENTAQVLREIRRARPSTLIVVADGPRAGDHPTDEQQCARTRQVIDEGVDWPCEVLKRYAPANLGCKRNIADGLTWAFTQVEQAIILEDDCVPEESFFGFCGEMLDRYRDEEQVMMVTGTNYFPDPPPHPARYFFSRYFAIWGWATWRRAWEKYDVAMSDWPQHRDKLGGWLPDPALAEFFVRGYQKVYAGAVDTWDVQWAYAGLKHGGLSVTPGVNLVSNIGVSGAHASGKTANHFRATAPIPFASLPQTTVAVNREYDRAVMNHACKCDRPRKSLAAKWRASFNKRLHTLRTLLRR